MTIPAHAATTHNAIAPSISDAISMTVVYDQPDLFSEQEEANILEAIRALNDSTGVEVRVIVLDNIGSYGNLDLYFSDLIDQTPVLQSPNGGLKTNLMVLVMSYEDRNRGIFYVVTGTLKNAFSHDPELSALQADYLIPEFQAGNFAQGFIGTINEAERVINNYLHPSATPKPAVEDNPAVNASEKSGPSGWIILIIFIGLIILAALVYLGYLFVQRYKRIMAEREEAEEARQSERKNAEKVCEDALAVFIVFTETNFEETLEAKIRAYAVLDPSKKNDLESNFGTFKMNYAEFVSTVSTTESNNGNVTDDTLPIEAYSNMIRAYRHALRKAENIKESVERVEAIIKKIDSQIESIPRQIEVCEELEAKASEQLAYVAEHELKAPDFTKEIETLSANFSKQKIDKHTVPTLNALQKTEKSFNKITDAISAIIEQDKKLSSSIPELEEDIIATKGVLSSVKKVFDNLKKHYAESSWDSVSGNGSEAEAVIEKVEQLLVQAKQRHTEKLYEDALGLVFEVQSGLDIANSLLSAIKSRRDDLASYKKRAPMEFDFAEADIKTAETYLKANVMDLNHTKYRADIDDAINDLRMAREEFAKPLPDFDKVIELALEANHDADRVLENCTSEVEHLKHLRYQIDETRKKVQGDIEEATRYIKNHKADIRSDASDLLKKAGVVLHSVSNFNHPSKELDEVRRAHDIVAEALKKAKQDVKKAEDEREEERRRQRRREEEEKRRRDSYHHTTIISSSNRSSSSFSSPSFGGSSGGFSSGSTSFGGSSGKW